MTVDEMLKLKEQGLTVEEIAQLAPHITTPVADTVNKPAAQSADTAILAQVAAGLTAMQEQLTKMQQESSAQMVQQLAEIQQKMQYGNINRPTGAEPVQMNDTAQAAADYIASVINPTTKQPLTAKEE